ncbi:MAG TPA: hypothetical protein VIT91_18120 [Chthoniobacterales bacterium]
MELSELSKIIPPPMAGAEKVLEKARADYSAALSVGGGVMKNTKIQSSVEALLESPVFLKTFRPKYRAMRNARHDGVMDLWAKCRLQYLFGAALENQKAETLVFLLNVLAEQGLANLIEEILEEHEVKLAPDPALNKALSKLESHKMLSKLLEALPDDPEELLGNDPALLEPARTLIERRQDQVSGLRKLEGDLCFLLSEGLEGRTVMQLYFAKQWLLDPDSIGNVTQTEIAEYFHETRAAVSHRVKQINKFLAKSGCLGYQARGQKSLSACAKYAAAAIGNKNRRKKAIPQRQPRTIAEVFSKQAPKNVQRSSSSEGCQGRVPREQEIESR